MRSRSLLKSEAGNDRGLEKEIFMEIIEAKKIIQMLLKQNFNLFRTLLQFFLFIKNWSGNKISTSWSKKIGLAQFYFYWGEILIFFKLICSNSLSWINWSKNELPHQKPVEAKSYKQILIFLKLILKENFILWKVFRFNFLHQKKLKQIKRKNNWSKNDFFNWSKKFKVKSILI